MGIGDNTTQQQQHMQQQPPAAGDDAGLLSSMASKVSQFAADVKNTAAYALGVGEQREGSHQTSSGEMPLTYDARRAAESAGETLKETGTAIQETVDEQIETQRDQAPEATREAAGAADAAAEKARELRDAAAAKASQIYDAAKTRAHDVAEGVAGAADTVGKGMHSEADKQDVRHVAAARANAKEQSSRVDPKDAAKVQSTLDHAEESLMHAKEEAIKHDVGAGAPKTN